MAAVRAALPADAVLCGDSSQVTYFGSVHFFDVPAPRRFCYSPDYATLGYGLPAGLGAAIGRPGTPVAVLLGDGAYVLRTGTGNPYRTTSSSTGDRRRQRRLSRDPRTGSRSWHPTDRSRTAHAGSGRAGGRHGRAGAAHHLDSRPLQLVSGALDADGPTLIHFDIR
jgi:hypothetical protein